MPNRSHRLSFAPPSNFDAEDGTSCISASTNARPVKRRRVAGLNTRFDHMIEKVNVMHSYPTSSPAISRRRMRSSGTSSVSSYDVPKTPLDPYSALHQGRLGKEFSVLRTNKLLDSALTRTELCQDSDEYAKLAAAPVKKPRAPLPDWLANTFCTLESEHPLRGLLSPSNIRPAEQPNPSHEEQVFAFSPFDEPDKVRGAPETHHTDDYPNIQDADLPDISEILTLCDSGPQSPGGIRTERDSLPFSTPGCFAPKPNSLENLPVDAIFPTSRPECRWSPRAQQDTSSCVTLAPLPIPPYDGMKRPRFTRESTTFTPDTLSPSGRQVDRALVNVFSQEYQKPKETISIYATPGPTFACSRPVYFDSPTEDPSFSDPLEPEAYELDLNAIDFRWRPFLRSNAQEGQANQKPDRPSRLQSFGPAASKETGDQTGWETRITRGHTDFDASAEQGLPSPLPEDKEEVHLEFSPNVAQQTGLATSMGAFNKTVGCNSPSPPSGPEQARHVRGLTLRSFLEKPHLEEVRMVQPYEIRPSTPTRQAQISQPATPRKDKSSQPRREPRPLFLKASAVPWMIPSKTPKRKVMLWDDIESKLSQTSATSHDTIESWGGFG
ncbi:hypothetical protein PAXINDRAFT_179109 [Paxillus involutus ATCC 200175]|nr:hypothetical protein PAXINDRAFT_179109 [Paxillus involutus ATCC 200175]